MEQGVLLKSKVLHKYNSEARHKYTGIDVAVKIINKKIMKAKKMIVKVKLLLHRSKEK